MVGDFDLKALYEAMDDQRRSRGITWAVVTREVNRFVDAGHTIATSTITGLKARAQGEGDGILQMLLWLGRTPESFVPGCPEPAAERFRLPAPGEGQVLRWDTAALHAALDARRRARGVSWQTVAREVGGLSAGALTHLAKGGRTGFPQVMRIVAWLEEPAAAYTRAVALRSNGPPGPRRSRSHVERAREVR